MIVRRFVIIALGLWTSSSRGAEWYVGPGGAAANPGTKQSPWDIASALDARPEVRPGDTIRLLAGTYRRRPSELFAVRLAGAPGRPITVCPAPGGRVRLDGGLAVQAPSAHLRIRDLEIFVSEPAPEKPISAGSHPPDLLRPDGGLHLHGGKDCKYINRVIHNWGKTDAVDVDTGGFAKEGDTIELSDPKDSFSEPVATTTRRNGILRVPIPGEFAVFLVRVDRLQRGPVSVRHAQDEGEPHQPQGEGEEAHDETRPGPDSRSVPDKGREPEGKGDRGNKHDRDSYKESARLASAKTGSAQDLQRGQHPG